MLWTRYWMVALAIALLLSATPVAAEQTAFQTYGQPTLEAIDAAYQDGEIDEATALLYRFFYVVSPEKLPARFALRGAAIKSGTPIILEVLDRLESMPAEIREQVERGRARPTGLSDTIESDHYIVHYSSTYTSSYVAQDVADAAETAWTAYHTDRTWETPPSDGLIGGGSGMIDCYITTTSTGVLGYASPEYPVTGAPSYDYTGYFVISRSITSALQRRATTSHEYMHIVQFGYMASPAVSWWMENCAMMGEEWAFDSINVYIGYLGQCFLRPFFKLETFDGAYEYGQVIWPMYQAERFADEVVEQVWYELKWSYNIYDSFDVVFAPYGYDLNSAYREYMKWCFYTSDRDDGNHFEEADLWAAKLWPDWTHSAYPTGEVHPVSTKRPEPLGTSVGRYYPEAGSGDNILEIAFDGPDDMLCVDIFSKNAASGVYTEYAMSLDASGDGTIDIPGFDQAEEVYLLASIARGYGTGRDYIMEADTKTGQGVEELNLGELVRIHPTWPNPLSERATIAYALPRPSAVEIRVLDASGRLVRQLFSGDQYPGSYEVTWDRRDDAGRQVANGVYYAMIRADGETLARQMTVID